MGVLNSKLLSKFYKTYFNSLSLAGGFYRIGAPQIKQLPIAIGNQCQIDEVVEYVERIQQCVIENKNDEIFDLESKIDELVYNIYGLSSDEMRMMQESH